MRVFEKNSNVFNLLSEAVSEGILVVNEEQIIVSANMRTNQMFGYEPDELRGQPLNILIPVSYRKSHQENVAHYYNETERRRLAEGRSLSGLRKNSEEFPIEVGLNPFTLYGHTYVMALIIDITERMEREEEIFELNKNLEKKIKLRTSELRDSVAELKREIKKRKEAEAKIKSALAKEKELNELKTKFLSLVSHEFKTPLSGILTSATLVGKYAKENQQDKRGKHLKTIVGQVNHLSAILTDFLSIERLETGKEIYKRTDFSLSKVINEVVYSANMLLKNGQRINYPQNVDDVSLYQDEKIISLCLTNLLYNAVKYSPEDTEIDVKVELSADRVVFHIKDQGIGIPEKDQKHIFDRYFRAENVLTTQGTGIGLNIVKTHVENLGGNIYFESKEKKGSTFSFELPIKLDSSK